MCETLDEIHSLQLAAVISRMRKEARQREEGRIEAVA